MIASAFTRCNTNNFVAFVQILAGATRQGTGMKKRLNLTTTQYIIIVCLLLLVVNAVLSMVLMVHSGKAAKELLRKHMLIVADTAVARIDGDELASLTAADAENKTEKWQTVANALMAVKDASQDNDIKYVYAIKKDTVQDGYVYTVDPDPIKPARYGEKVVASPGQDAAWGGTATVDDDPVEDEWGNFYSAWSPVKNGAGEVVGLVGIDFDAAAYDRQVIHNTIAVVLVGVLSLTVGIVIMLLLTGQLRRRFRALNTELSTLSGDVEKLSDEIKICPGDEEPEPETDESADTIEAISGKIRIMQKKLKAYMQYAEEQAYTDSMTGVGNKTAYLNHIKVLGSEINAGTAAFAVAVFDINSLKSINDNYGHECGDRIITDAAMVIRRIFPNEKMYRIGGDEFITVLGATTEDALTSRFEQLLSEVENFNLHEKHYAMTLSLSCGGAVYQPGQDADFKEVFKRADQAMYQNKGDYYRLYGDRRRSGNNDAE